MKETDRPSTAALLKQRATTYDALAPSYYAERFANRPGRYDLDETTALLKDVVPALIGERSTAWCALDVACGTGKIAIAVAQLGGTVVALDTAQSMLDQCATRAKEAGVDGNLTVVQAGADALPFDDAAFDLVFSFRFLHLLPRDAYPQLLREMVRVTRPGGHIVFEVKNRWYGGAVYQLKDAVRRARGGGPASSTVSVRCLPALAAQVGGVTRWSTKGLILPKGWWLAAHPRLKHIARTLARGPLKAVSAHLVVIYRKDRSSSAVA
ncbi:MAG: putative S-adenosylmethionine-dependent methyltransferase [Chloroflexi bacterium]|nr:putative S-adenosylmethionine-dependent methyltransferase [Chloroflexota bacterium]